MITGIMKNKIDRIWTILWTEGSTNPLTNIEQLTYLIFMKGLDESELEKEKDNELLGINDYIGIFPRDKQHIRWNSFKNLGDAQQIYSIIQNEAFPFIKSLGGKEESAFSVYMKEAIFQINKPATLQRIISIIDELPTEDNDTKGDIYEYLLSKLAQSGTNGQFRTPRQIIEMMVELMQPKPEDSIIDPAMGTAGFLVQASEYLRKHHDDLFNIHSLNEHFHKSMFFGNDMDNTMLRIGAMNMMLHGVDEPQISYRDSLSEDNVERDKYTLVLANPPFKGSLDYESVSNDLLTIAKTKKTELLFLNLFLRILKPGGRAAVIVPDGVLFGSSKAHKDVRKAIVEDNKLEAIIKMPSGVFKPYAGVSTAILIFTKTNDGGTDNVWFYDMKADGYSLDDKRSPIKENDIPDIIERYHNIDKELERKRTDKSFFVSFEEIKKNDWDLSINKYKEIEYEKKEYRKPSSIIEDIKKAENDIINSVRTLEDYLNENS
ncbi:class I SAM-dependent DNA methyltransferase [Mammaliicoccus sp. H-M34]|uniref:type I restriction-modification system subunit M n=1 Tax=Mammaliicoccus sp. H-M34 TaxID=2898693 RepID=UPI001EFB5B79|nr:class I SAM-dependent DNA methyltransferase [Mammaliicoccus sp. H-M34]